MDVRKHSVSGSGVFAGEAIAAGTLVFPLTGKKVARHEIDASDYSLHMLQIDTDMFLLAEGGDDDYVNHSCDPNVCFSKDGLHYMTLRDIRAGEELFFDYSTSENDPHWSMMCLCGSPKCRGAVTGFSRLRAADKARLAPIALPYIRANYKENS